MRSTGKQWDQSTEQRGNGKERYVNRFTFEAGERGSTGYWLMHVKQIGQPTETLVLSGARRGMRCCDTFSTSNFLLLLPFFLSFFFSSLADENAHAHAHVHTHTHTPTHEHAHTNQDRASDRKAHVITQGMALPSTLSPLCAGPLTQPMPPCRQKDSVVCEHLWSDS